MAISKNLEIKINNDQASFTEKFYVYQNDRGIDLYIKVNIPKLQFGNKSVSLLSELDGVTAGAVILKPDKSVIGRSNLGIVNDAIKFTIDKELTDEISEIGIYKIQFHLYDSNDNRLTIPPVEFEVKELIGVLPSTR